MRAVQITRFGGPEVMDVVDLPDPVPGDGQQLYEVSSAGVNFADTHQIEDSYLAAQQLPLVPGAEFVGTSAGGGPRVVGLLDGGGYAEKVVAHPRLTLQVPDGLNDEQALRWGAGRVIATASSPEKRALTQELGADAAIDPALADDDPKAFTAALREANGGRPVDVVLEMTGGNVFAGSLSALAPFGRLVTYGMAARQETAAVPPGMLLQKSRAVVGFWLEHCMARPAMLDNAMAELLPLVGDGALRPVVGGRYPLSAVREAHHDLLSRRTTGKLVLDPSR